MRESRADLLKRAEHLGADLLRLEREKARRNIGERIKEGEFTEADIERLNERDRKAAEQPVEARVRAWLERHPEDVPRLAAMQPITDWAAAERALNREEKTLTIAQRLDAEVEAERALRLAAEREVEAPKYNATLDAILLIKRSGPLQAAERQRLLIALRDLALFVRKMAEGDRKLATLKKARAEYVATADAARRIFNHPSDIAPIAIDGIEVERMMRQLGDAVRQEIATIDAMVESGNALNTVWEPRRDPGQRGVDAELACAIVVHEVYLTVSPSGGPLPHTNTAAHAACLEFWRTCTGLDEPKTVWLDRLRLARNASKSTQTSVQAFRDRVRGCLSGC